MKSAKLLLAAAMTGLLAAGCSTVQNVSPSDLSVAELEAKQTRAVDPGKRINTIKTSILRQEITTSQGWMEPETTQMVEIKYQAPDKMCLTTFEDNQPMTTLIINGNQAWRVNYEQKSVETVPSGKLDDLKFMLMIAKPNSKMSELFDQITIDRCTIDDEPLYRLTCLNPDQNPFYVFVAANDYLPRRIISDIKLLNGGSTHYDSQILRYQMHEGLLIADETVINQDGLKQKGKMLYYKVNPPLNAKDFLPPAF